MDLQPDFEKRVESNVREIVRVWLEDFGADASELKANVGLVMDSWERAVKSSAEERLSGALIEVAGPLHAEIGRLRGECESLSADLDERAREIQALQSAPVVHDEWRGAWMRALKELWVPSAQKEVLAKLQEAVSTVSRKHILFVLKKGQAQGWGACGYEAGWTDDVLKSFSVPADGDFLLGNARSMRESCIMSADDLPEGEAALSIPGFRKSSRFMIAPLTILGTVVAILYVEAEELEMDEDSALLSMDLLTGSASMWLENLAMRKSLGLPARDDFQERPAIRIQPVERQEVPGKRPQDEVPTRPISPPPAQAVAPPLAAPGPPRALEAEQCATHPAPVAKPAAPPVVAPEPARVAEPPVPEHAERAPAASQVADTAPLRAPAPPPEQPVADFGLHDVVEYDADQDIQIEDEEIEIVDEPTGPGLMPAGPTPTALEARPAPSVGLSIDQLLSFSPSAEPARVPPGSSSPESFLANLRETLAPQPGPSASRYDSSATTIQQPSTAYSFDRELGPAGRGFTPSEGDDQEEIIILDEKPMEDILLEENQAMVEVALPIKPETVPPPPPPKPPQPPPKPPTPPVQPKAAALWGTPEEERLHIDAKRFARLLVSEIKLYNEESVSEGRLEHDLYRRLRRDVDRSREMYEKRVAPQVAAKADYFHEELVRILGEGDSSKLGADYPGAQTR